MTRLLAIAEWLFGPSARRDVFEPMLADREREIADAGPRAFVIRLRWAKAIAMAFLMSAPGTLTVQMPAPLKVGVIRCLAAFLIVPFIIVWPFVHFNERPWLDWQQSLASFLPFAMIPIVWRFRVAGIPEHQRRALSRAFVLVVVALALALGEGDWPARAALAIAVLWLAFCGWRLGSPNRLQYDHWLVSFWIKLALTAGNLLVATWPLKLALGMDLYSPYWPGQPLLVYTMAGLTAVTLKSRFNGFTSFRL